MCADCSCVMHTFTSFLPHLNHHMEGDCGMSCWFVFLGLSQAAFFDWRGGPSPAGRQSTFFCRVMHYCCRPDACPHGCYILYRGRQDCLQVPLIAFAKGGSCCETMHALLRSRALLLLPGLVPTWSPNSAQWLSVSTHAAGGSYSSMDRKHRLLLSQV